MQAECEFENLYFGRKYLQLFQDFASNYVVEVFVYWSIIVTNIATNINNCHDDYYIKSIL